jgi:hypothetical protein
MTLSRQFQGSNSRFEEIAMRRANRCDLPGDVEGFGWRDLGLSCGAHFVAQNARLGAEKGRVQHESHAVSVS